METVLNMISNLAPPPPSGHPLALPAPPSPTTDGNSNNNNDQHQRPPMAPPTVSAPSPVTVVTVGDELTVSTTTATMGSSPRPPSSAATMVAKLSPTRIQMSPTTTTTMMSPQSRNPQQHNIVVVQQQQQSPRTMASSNGNTTPAGQPTPPARTATGRTFFRAPGLEAPDADANGDFPTNALVCPDCGFSCSSKFHYNSHRNTHSKHQCPMCNFETRTEGRLKKHMLQSHKREQRFAHGINLQSPPPPPPPQAPAPQHSPATGDNRNGTAASGGEQCANNNIMQQIYHQHMGQQPPPNSMNSLLHSMFSSGAGDNGTGAAAHMAAANGTLALESLQSMLNNTNPLAHFTNSDALLKICTDAISGNGGGGNAADKISFHSPTAGGAGGQIPLDQLRALTERHTANMMNSSNSMGNAFGHMHIGPDGVMIDPSRQNGAGADHPLNGMVKPENGASGSGATPRRSGKPKQYKCKQCPHISRSKKEQWEHARLHIPKQKQLTCELCDFVTEYKHHLEYHYRNHNGQKPFKCTICDYTCVNKSMLNSHMKSHTPVYQFRCQDCTYQTKYCHSLKMHLKKYNHKRAPGPSGFVDSSGESHGEERPENASSSSLGREDTASFENGAAPNTDGGPENTATSSSSTDQQMMEQHAAGAGILQHHHALLHMQGPVGASGEEQHELEQRMMLQQQLDQMHELIRAAVVNCPHCNFSTGNIDDMNRHLMWHLIATQQQMPPQHAPQMNNGGSNNEQEALTMTSIYQRLAAQLHHELGANTAAPPMDVQTHHHPHAPALLSPLSQHHQDMLIGRALAAAHAAASQPQGEPMELDAHADDAARARQMERDAAESIHQQHMLAATTRNTTSTNVADADTGSSTSAQHADTSTAANTASSASSTTDAANGGTQAPPTSSSPIRNSVKREFGAAFQLHHHLDHPSSSSSGSPSVGTPHLTHSSTASGPSSGGGATGTCVVTNVLPHRLMSSASLDGAGSGLLFDPSSGSSLPDSLSKATNGTDQSSSGAPLPFFCQQCEIAFKDAALYQVHRGFHARESPFKCNICGHVSCSSLDFNLHLYQAKHE